MNLNQKYAYLVKQAQSIMADNRDPETGLVPEAKMREAQNLIGQADEIKVQLDLGKRLDEAEAFGEQSQGTQAARHGWREAIGDEGAPTVDIKSWRELKMKHPVIPGDELVIRYIVPRAVEKKDYPFAFESYIRKGMNRVGPADRKTLTEGMDDAGGFWAPEQMQAEVLRRTAAASVVRTLARIVTTGRDTVKWPRLVYTGADNDKYTSPVRLTWTGELPSSSTVHRVTDPNAGLLTIPVHTAMASLPFSNDLLEDAMFDVFGLGAELMGESFGLGEEDVFTNGTGANQPLGMVTGITVGTETIGTVASGDASTLTGDGIVDLHYGLPAQYRRNARYLLNSQTAKVIRKLKDGNSRFIWDSMQSAIHGSLVSPGDQDVLLGKGVNFNEFMPDVAASAHPILFGDYKGYFIVDRVGLSIKRMEELYAESNITVLLARKRTGGSVAEPYRFRAQVVST